MDKVTALHPHMLLAKVLETEGQYAKVVAQYGIINGHISFARLTPSNATNIEFDDSCKIALFAACKKCIV